MTITWVSRQAGMSVLAGVVVAGLLACLRSAVEPLSGRAATWGGGRSRYRFRQAGAILGGDRPSGFMAVRRDLKLAWTEYPVGDDDASWDRVAVARLAPAVDVARPDQDEPSGSARTECVRQA